MTHPLRWRHPTRPGPWTARRPGSRSASTCSAPSTRPSARWSTRHLATCRDCRDELAGLAGLPALLARVSTEEAIALAADRRPGRRPAGPSDAEPPRELLATVLDLTAARRRRPPLAGGEPRRGGGADHRGRACSAACGSASSPAQPSTAVGGSFAGQPNGPWETAHRAVGGGMTATVSYRSMGWGTQLDAKVTGIPVGTNCQLWVIDSAGQPRTWPAAG